MVPEFNIAHHGEATDLEPVPGMYLCTAKNRKNQLDNETDALQGFNEDYKEAFHHALCLLSIAVAKHQFGRTAQWPSIEQQGVAYIEAVEAWADGTGSDFDQMLECIEVYDFLYYYINPTVIPVRDGWVWNEAADIRVVNADRFHLACQHLIYPSDIADLVKNEAWRGDAPYPVNKQAWMLERGLEDGFRRGIQFNWWEPFQRTAKVKILGAMPVGDSVANGNGQLAYFDGYRQRSGSPFMKAFPWPNRCRVGSVPAVVPAYGRNDERHGKEDNGHKMV